MSLPVNKNSDDYRFYKTLNMDVQLKPSSETSQHYDVQMENGDFVNVSGSDSLENACIIAILTRYNELRNIPTYQGFGCRVHDLIKDNKTRMFLYKLEISLTEVLTRMRRIKTVNWLNIVEEDTHSYSVVFNVTSINDEIVTGEVAL